MKSIIVGTAGHIDHGKTSLVKALTGIDADRLEEEKRRGITIDLGFAYMELSGADGMRVQVGFVDVPGHERFVRNMLAGVSGIDVALLVIAADESIKPQTREHFEILQLLGVQRGITVLTKSDSVDPETLEVVRSEVEEFLRGTFLEGQQAPIIAVSSLTGAGLEDLKQAMHCVAKQIESRDSQSLVRFPIDRVFTMKGFGTVVTGTLISGTIHSEDELEVFPGGRIVRVRGVQVHGRRSSTATAGQRTALNVAGASKEDLARGTMLARPKTFSATRNVDVQLHLLSSAPRALKDRSKVHFHAHAMETTGEVILYRSNVLNPEIGEKSGALQLPPGSEAFARMRLPQASLLLPGDRFIIRQFSPVITIGGGVVLDAAPIPDLKRGALDSFLTGLASGNPETMLISRIARRGYDGLTMAQAVSETGWRSSVVSEHLARPLSNGRIWKFSDLYMDSAAINSLREVITEALSQFHKKNPLAPGMSKEMLREQLDLSMEIFAAVIELMISERRIAVANDLLHIPGHSVVMRDDEAQSKKIIEDAFAAAGLKVPALQEVIAGLKIDRARAQKIVTLLLRERSLIKLSEDLVFHRTALEELRRQVVARKAKSSRMDVALFKEMTGVSRKYAIPLLEYLDRERITRRVGDAREIL